MRRPIQRRHTHSHMHIRHKHKQPTHHKPTSVTLTYSSTLHHCTGQQGAVLPFPLHTRPPTPPFSPLHTHARTTLAIMELDFWTFCLCFFIASFLLAFLELAIKSKPISRGDYERTYGIPAGLDLLDYQNGAWRHKATGKLATKQEVEGVGLVWPKTPPGSAKGEGFAEGETRSSRGTVAGGEGAGADKKRD